jgi:drug/metabolite transporter (DMT)-like permease
MAFMVAAMLVVPFLDVIAKLLMERLPTGQVATGRFLVQSLIMLPIVLGAGAMKRPERLHALAGIFLGLALFCLNAGLREMPVANVAAIFFVEPLVLTLLAGLILREGIGRRRLTAVFVGLLGALVVLRPNVAAYGWSAAWPLAAAVLIACHMLVTRVMSQRGGRLALQFWTGIFALATLTVLTLAIAAAGVPGGALVWPTVPEVMLLVLMGVVAIIAHQLILQALARADAAAIAPLQYLEIIGATALGWLVFADFPDPLTWAGTAIIVSAGVYVFHRERMISRGLAAPVRPGRR